MLDSDACHTMCREGLSGWACLPASMHLGTDSPCSQGSMPRLISQANNTARLHHPYLDMRPCTLPCKKFQCRSFVNRVGIPREQTLLLASFFCYVGHPSPASIPQ